MAGTKIELATDKLLSAALTDAHYIPLGKIGETTSMATALLELKLWLGSLADKIFEDVTSVETIDTGTGKIEFTVDNVLLFTVNTADGIFPALDDNLDLGSATKQFKDLYVNTKAYLDSIELGTTTQTVNEIVTVLGAGTDAQLATAAAIDTAIGASSAARWFSLTATQTSTSTFTSNTLLDAGTAVYWTDGAIEYYGIIDSVVTAVPNVYTIIGYPMGVGATAYYYGIPEVNYSERFHVAGAFGVATITAAASAGMLYDYLNMKLHYVWEGKPARLVGIKTSCFVDDTTLDPTVNVSVNNGGAGAYNAVFSSNVDVDITGHDSSVTAQGSPYKVLKNDQIDISIVLGTDGNASDMDITLMFVLV